MFIVTSVDSCWYPQTSLGHNQSLGKKEWVNTINNISLLKMALEIQLFFCFVFECDRVNFTFKVKK